MCVLEREIPIQVKQEPVEINELNPEPDKSKSRYKKNVLPPPVSVVSFLPSLSFKYKFCWAFLSHVNQNRGQTDFVDRSLESLQVNSTSMV